jgi:hypothetical protein
MTKPQNEIRPNGPSCSKCGHGNVADAMYCSDCGFFLGESEQVADKSAHDDFAIRLPGSAIDKPPSTTLIPDKQPKIPRCIRCGQSVEGLERCQVCGLITPYPPEVPDEFLTDFMVHFPVLITNPGAFVDNQQYSLGWTTLIQPILWTTLAFILFWAVSLFSRGTAQIPIYGSMMDFNTFLMTTMAIIVIVFPWILLIYILVFQLVTMLLGGRGRIERTCKAVCTMMFGLLLLLGTLFALYNYATHMIRFHSEYLSDSPWEMHYRTIPLIIKSLIIIAQVYFLTIQIRILARVNYIDVTRSIAAHILVFIPFIVYFGLDHYGLI